MRKYVKDNMDTASTSGSFRSWSKLLRCCICLGIYHRPHTLPCGHSFCTSCLRNLASLRRNQYPQVPITRLKITCPTCRKKTLAVSVLKRRLSVNYSIQDFVENWREQDKEFLNGYYVTLRSVSTQSDETTPTPADDTTTDPHISAEEVTRLPCRVDVMSFPNFDQGDESLNDRVSIVDDFSEHSDSVSDTSSNDELSDNLDRLVLWRVERRPAFIGFADVFRIWLREIVDTVMNIFECRSRSIMAMIWCGYTFSIMIIANGFFPYMILYTFLFFVILYAETAQQRRDRTPRRIHVA